jgi:hypothetical protein
MALMKADLALPQLISGIIGSYFTLGPGSLCSWQAPRVVLLTPLSLETEV